MRQDRYLFGAARCYEEGAAHQGMIVGLDETFSLCEIEDGRVEGAVQPGRYWLSTRQGIIAPFTVVEDDPRARIELGGATLVVRLAEGRDPRRNIQVVQAVPSDADPFLRLAAARAHVKVTLETPALFRLHPGRYVLVGQAGTRLREVEVPPEGLEVVLD